MQNGSGSEFLLAVNEKNSAEFVGQQERRRKHRKKHPTEIAIYKCGDGRLNVSVMTETPLGIFQPFRNIGGIFNLGWPHFQDVVQARKDYADSKCRDSLSVSTYHFSRGSKGRGCAGHNYDTNGACHCSLSLKKDLDGVYWGPDVNGSSKLFAIQVGIETDLESLILHGEDGSPIDLADVADDEERGVKKLLARLYPKINDLAENVIDDLVPLVQGNIRHSQRIRKLSRPLQDLDHRESVLAVGRGFDWLHLPNTAVIVGPWQLPDPSPIRTAAGVLQKNLQAGLIEKPVLLTSAVYNKTAENKSWPERKGLAKLKSLWLKDFTLAIIRKEFEELLPKLQVLVTTVDLNTRKLDVIHSGSAY